MLLGIVVATSIFIHYILTLETEQSEVSQDFSISKNGFQYGKLSAPNDIDYTDNVQVVEKYLPLLEQYLTERYVSNPFTTWFAR